MKKLLETISLKTNLTKIEVRTFGFIIIIFIVGLIAKSIKIDIETKPIRKFNYSFNDSLFKAIRQKSSKELLLIKKKEKRVDSEVKLSNFSKLKLVSKKKSNFSLKEASININTADVMQLKKLPGIGSKTAQKIIALRNKKKGLKSLDELLEVRGIGLKKLDKIKKFIYIEK